MRKSGTLPLKKPNGEDCPIFTTLGLIANKWSIQILEILLRADKNTQRFTQIKKALGTITQRELTKHLREFEKSGIVTRVVYNEMPLRVEYTLTDMGKSLCAPIEALSLWAEKNGTQIQKMRQQFEGKK